MVVINRLTHIRYGAQQSHVYLRARFWCSVLAMVCVFVFEQPTVVAQPIGVANQLNDSDTAPQPWHLQNADSSGGSGSANSDGDGNGDNNANDDNGYGDNRGDNNSDSKHTVTLSFIGDIMAHTPNYSMDDYSRIYAQIAPVLQSDDITFSNLEAPINNAQPYQTYPRFNVQTDYVEAAIDGGVDFFSVANNHVNDWGDDSILGTTNALSHLMATKKEDGFIGYNGIKPQLGAQLTVTPITIYGITIGVLAVTQFVNVANNARDMVQLINYNNPTQAAQLVSFVKQQSPQYDLFVISYHGGVEYQLEPTESKRTLFLQLIEAGADIIWGHHPHVLQPWEIVPRNGRADGIIMYSLGNFISSQTWFVKPNEYNTAQAETGDSIVFGVTYQLVDNTLQLATINTVPITHYITADRGVVVRRYPHILFDNTLSEQMRSYYQNRYSILQQRYKFGEVSYR